MSGNVGLGETPTHPQPLPGREGRVNSARGEAGLRIGGATLVLRPSFAALVAAEQEVGPLFALVERFAEGRLSLSEMVTLFWHCLAEPPEGLTRERFSEAVAVRGLAANMPALKALVGQILAGR
ncbi:gene transfer agent family protein [Sphingomonas sp. MMS12-HWE2-04]|uniref:gene transfer agent family protein n=1 Tax=Sphingomonas sp. MMS12-HWE2-04 TaxID=3234199 RepID=UPI00384AA78A